MMIKAMFCAHTGSTRSEISHRAGFTLMEIVVAIFIFSLVVGLVMGAFQGVFSNADHIGATSELQEMGNACLNRMVQDLQSIHVSLHPRYKQPDIDDQPDLYHFVGRTGDSFSDDGSPRLRFASLAHLAFSRERRGGIAEIVYYLQRTGRDHALLRRADHLFPYPEKFEPNAADPIMCEKVLALDFIFYSAQGDEKERWDSQSADDNYSTPCRISISLKIGDKEAPMVFNTQVVLPLCRFKEKIH